MYIFRKIKNAIYYLLMLGGILTSCRQVTIVVEDIPRNTPRGAVLFVAGNFNIWDPGDQSFMLQRNKLDSTYSVTLPRGSGTVEFKFTRGDWTTVEQDGCGNELPNRSFRYGDGDTIFTQILSWEDLGPVDCDLVTFVVKPPANTPPDNTIYLTGNFNDWNPQDQRFSMHRQANGLYTIDLPRQFGSIEYKFTRGGWDREEADEYGDAIPNRKFTYGVADSIFIDIPNWKDIGNESHPMVAFMVKVPENTLPQEKLYIVGNFNNWYPGDENFRLKRVKDDLYTISLPDKLKRIEFKFTRGSWATEEVDANGNKISNRSVYLGDADTVSINIPGWIDRPGSL
jgi:hypothetical protein